MILTCPNCSVKYSASADAIGPEGRKVRCASCGHNWQVDAEGKELATKDLKAATSAEFTETIQEPEAPQPTPEPQIRRDPKVAMALRARREAERQKQRRIRTAGTWAAIVVSLLVVLASTWVFREQVVRMWPNTASAFAVFGIKTNIYGLEIQQLTAIRKMRGGASILLISGNVQNISKRKHIVPLLKFQLFDKQDQPVFSWKLQMPASQIDPGATIPFATEVRDPPPGALRMDVAFSDETTEPEQGAKIEIRH